MPPKKADAQVKMVGSVRQFLDQVDRTARALPTRPIWWRGHAVSTWRLLPSVHRDGRRAGNTQYEHGVTTRFMARARPRYANPPASNDLPGWLALMQHYGLPTRLMDWSESPLVGLYFAVCNPRRDRSHGAVWALDPSTMNEALHGTLGTLSFRAPLVTPVLSEINIPFADEKPDVVVALTPSHVDQRMMIQQSSFTIHGSSADLRKQSLREQFLREIRIDREGKKAIRKDLETLGFTRAYLFPDLENLAKFERAKGFAPQIGPKPPPVPLAIPSSGWGMTLEAPTKEELEEKARAWVREKAAAGFDVCEGWSPSRARRSENGWSIDLLVNS